MTFGDATHWIEEHPTESIVIGAGGLIALLWLLGYFGSSTTTASSGASNLASAYYAAEAQQAVVGGQIQEATIAANQATSIATTQANAAVAIQQSQSNAATTINQQNVTGATTLGNQGLLATYSNNATALSAVQSNNAAAVAVNQSNNDATAFQTIFGSLIPTEMQLTGGQFSGGGFAVDAGSLGSFGVSPTTSTPASLAAGGYSPAQATKYLGL